MTSPDADSNNDARIGARAHEAERSSAEAERGAPEVERGASEAALSAAGRPLPKRWFAIIVTIWAGQAVSMITSYAAGYAAIWYVTETTGSALALSLMTIFAMLPTGVLSPFGGVIADRFNRKTVMIVSDLGVGVVSLALGFLLLFGDISFALIALFAAARSIGQAFHSPAMMATLPLLVPSKHLMRINTLDQLLMSIVSIGAPAFGILLYTTIGFHSVPRLFRRALRGGRLGSGKDSDSARRRGSQPACVCQPARRLARAFRKARFAYGDGCRNHRHHDFFSPVCRVSAYDL